MERPDPFLCLLHLATALIHYGVCFFFAQCALKTVIRWDEEGVALTAGTRHETAKWKDVAAYYFVPTKRDPEEEAGRLVLLDGDGNILFKEIFIAKSPAILAGRSRLIEYAKARLDGKRLPAPALEVTALRLARESLEQDRWSGKRLGWRVKRALYLLTWAAGTSGVMIGSLLWFSTLPFSSSGRQTRDEMFVILFFGTMYIPFWAYLISILTKTKRIERERRENQTGTSPRGAAD